MTVTDFCDLQTDPSSEWELLYQLIYISTTAGGQRKEHKGQIVYITWYLTPLVLSGAV